MKRLTSYCLTALVAVLGASTANAVELTITSDYNGTDVLSVGDTIDITYTINADILGIQAIGIATTFDPNVFEYQLLNTTEQGVATYILYTPQGMSGFALYPIPGPQTSPGDPSIWGHWLFFANPPPGRQQLLIQWGNASFQAVQTTGVVTLGVIRLEVIGESTSPSQINVVTNDDLGGTIFQANNVEVPLPITGAPILVQTPEPGVALLGLTALVSLAGLRRRSRRS